MKRICKILIITPLFFNDASGSAVYYKLLASHLIKMKIKVAVISDKEEGVFDDISYYHLFPKRSGQNTRRWRDLISYAFQNIQYFKISKIIKRERPDTIIVHTSFYNHLGLFPYIISRYQKKFQEIKWVADSRDRLTLKGNITYLNKYKYVISCSENISTFLEKNNLPVKKINKLPVLQENIKRDKVKETAAQLPEDLLEKKYILYVGSIKKEKNVDLLLNAFILKVKPIFPDYIFVLVGLLKSNDRDMQRKISHDSVKYLGSLPRVDVLTLMRHAKLCINISPNEGMPRSSLEALALKCPTLLPPNIPEFEKYCPELVVSAADPYLVGEHIVNFLSSKNIPSTYPIHYHYIHNVLPCYLQLIMPECCVKA